MGSLVVFWSSALTLCLFLSGYTSASGRPCPCTNKNLCQPVTSRKQFEVYAFALSKVNWPLYDWKKLTTISLVGFLNDSLLCHAHENGVRVEKIVNFPTANLTVEPDRNRWITETVSLIRENFLDGVNIDFEDEIDHESPKVRDALTSLVKGLYTSVKKEFPNARVTFDVAWSPDCIDRRCYDYYALSQWTDFLFIMSYDERSQFAAPCVAWANSAFNTTQMGLKQYLAIGVPADKLVLGIPWYGYAYTCLSLDQSCHIKEVSFRASECSDAAGRQYDYSAIQKQYLPASTTGRLWEPIAMSPYFNYKDKSTGVTMQFWYDDPASLTYKYKLAQQLKFRGVGTWNADSVDYSSTKKAVKQRQEMWGAFPSG